MSWKAIFRRLPELLYLRRGLAQPGGKLPLFDLDGQDVDAASRAALPEARLGRALVQQSAEAGLAGLQAHRGGASAGDSAVTDPGTTAQRPSRQRRPAGTARRAAAPAASEKVTANSPGPIRPATLRQRAVGALQLALLGRAHPPAHHAHDRRARQCPTAPSPARRPGTTPAGRRQAVDRHAERAEQQAGEQGRAARRAAPRPARPAAPCTTAEQMPTKARVRPTVVSPQP